jgi:DNA mismatch endonuclease (patch repair protein)
LYFSDSLLEEGITGWEKHRKDILGKPDFYFPDLKLALFVDGCFWHACPKCKRNTPHTRTEFWREKIETNRRRDNRIRRKLRAQGYHVMRVWEHDLKKKSWLKRLQSFVRRINNENTIENQMVE